MISNSVCAACPDHRGMETLMEEGPWLIFLNLPAKWSDNLLAKTVEHKDKHVADFFLLVAGVNLVNTFAVLV